MFPRTRRSAVLAAVTVVAAAVLPATAARATAPTDGADTKAPESTVTRAEVLQRADFWVREAVPYSQRHSYRDPQGAKYRADSSGYASMAWHLPTSLTTRTLPTVSHRITKDELRPGDVLLNPDQHVVIFAGWADKKRSSYLAYEQTPPHAQRHTLPYPYYRHDKEYLPYRYNGVK
ncbi:hypothetical protein [Streptomyces sp. NPDC051684]|uniref:hypothetical protein n=1 Tax=Streptomyces sp. NPDC051684 TaxID=3365670 RepID=UPI00378CE20E